MYINDSSNRAVDEIRQISSMNRISSRGVMLESSCQKDEEKYSNDIPNLIVNEIRVNFFHDIMHKEK